ncbi:hypothetical protein [Mesobacillus maritimus]|uniref:hypothetical protein n=1 Tax=Mesobacillus maritimus TaxID=1643336 RepID=UPI00384B2C9B
MLEVVIKRLEDDYEHWLENVREIRIYCEMLLKYEMKEDFEGQMKKLIEFADIAFGSKRAVEILKEYLAKENGK